VVGDLLPRREFTPGSGRWRWWNHRRHRTANLRIR
jgi:hypothetical protein